MSAIGVWSMTRSLHTIVETPEFGCDARRILTEAERRELIDFLAAHPSAGELMQGTGGGRKLRWGARSKGKRGGARIISYYGGPDIPVAPAIFSWLSFASNLRRRTSLILRMAHRLAGIDAPLGKNRGGLARKM